MARPIVPARVAAFLAALSDEWRSDATELADRLLGRGLNEFEILRKLDANYSPDGL